MADNGTPNADTTSTPGNTSQNEAPPANPPATPPAPNTTPDTVPYARFKEKVDALADLQGQLSALTGKATKADELAAQVANLNTQIARQNAAAAAGLSAEYMPYILGTTADEMAASAKFLADRLANVNAPNINADAVHNQPPTFTLSQLMDAKFFRENEAAIMQAQREGRIVQG